MTSKLERAKKLSQCFSIPFHPPNQPTRSISDKNSARSAAVETGQRSEQKLDEAAALGQRERERESISKSLQIDEDRRDLLAGKVEEAKRDFQREMAEEFARERNAELELREKQKAVKIEVRAVVRAGWVCCN